MFKIFTDSSANLSEELVNKYDITVVPFTYSLDGEEYLCYEKGKEFDYRSFYDKVRAKMPLKTSMVNCNTFYDYIKPYAEKGEKVLYIGMSSGFSGTFNAGKTAIEMLKDEYKDFTAAAIDSLTASYGEGLICHYAASMRDDGVEFEQVIEKIQNIINKLRSRFICDDLFHLKRGGRISATTALAGTVLGIKPVLRTTNDGRIETYSKARGRKTALDMLIDELKADIDKSKKQIIAMSHSDCQEDADYVLKQLKNIPTIIDVLCEKMEPTTSIHVGPGGVAIFYIANEK